MSFDIESYEKQISRTSEFLRKKLPQSFSPFITLTLGSGGFGELSKLIDQVVLSFPYSDIPGFSKTTVVGHEGQLIFGYVKKIPIMILKGRSHYYEIGPNPDQTSSLKTVTFPIYIANRLGSKIYFATNAAGGLNTTYKIGDLMLIKSHISLFVPNPLLGPVVSGSPRFVPQNMQYHKKYRNIFMKNAKALNEFKHVYEGVYCGLTGTTYESQAESIMLRKLGADAVGMSTVPEIIVATSLGMETIGLSLITNVIAKDGTNATSHEEVMKALNNQKIKIRLFKLMNEFFSSLTSNTT